MARSCSLLIPEEEYHWEPEYDARPLVESDLLLSLRQISKRAGENGVSRILPEPQRPSLSQQPSSSLCRQCREVVSGERQDAGNFGPFRHSMGQNLNQLEISASRGCHLCWVRRAHLAQYEDLSCLSRTSDIKFGSIKNVFGTGLGFEYTKLHPDAWPCDPKSYLTACHEPYLASVLYHLRREESYAERRDSENTSVITCSNNTRSSFELIKYWINECDKSHQECRRLRSVARSLPSRLIDLGGGIPIQPVVCSTSTLQSATRYAALSHCWGGQDSLQLLNRNVKSFSKNIPVQSLSKTFRHAMEVTKRLGLRYIWIDSLCIIQDCSQDWKLEASHMGKIYQNAYLTIAATGSKDGSGGLFRNREIFDVEPCKVETRWNGHGREFYFCHELDIWAQVNASPLLLRGWVVQEMVLSPRILHFGRTQMFWDCLGRRACETFPDTIPGQLSRPLRIQNLSLQKTFHRADWESNRHWLWNRVVELYSRGNLTFGAKDKLIAIAGMAQALGLPKKDYLAGLWRSGLEQQLLWRTNNRSALQDRRVEAAYRAPSWSWAYIDKEVSMHEWYRNHQTSDNLVSIEEAHAELVDNRLAFGQVSSGYIRLKCMIARTSYQSKHECLAHVFLDQGIAAEGEILYCMPVMRQGSTYGWIIQGLVIEPVRQQRCEYTRRGYFSTKPGWKGERQFLALCGEIGGSYQKDESHIKLAARKTAEKIERHVILLS